MSNPEPNIKLDVDLTNPGQFFACCGLLELADRLWPGAEGWFESHSFLLACRGNLEELVTDVTSAELRQMDEENDTSSPIEMASKFRLTLDWWAESWQSARGLKVWAGSMRNVRIAKALQLALANLESPVQILDYAVVAYDPENSRKKVEPFYFDSRRGKSATSLDIGFSPDSLSGMTTLAYPGVELLCLVGLQRFRPANTQRRRVFDYTAWSISLPVALASVACAGLLSREGGTTYRFENGFRTDQKKHKAFLPATPLEGATP